MTVRGDEIAALPDETQAQSPLEQSLDDLRARYIAGEEAGSAPDRQELLRQHPQHAADLREFFANRDQMQRLAEPWRGNTALGRPSALLGKLRYFGDYELLPRSGSARGEPSQVRQ